jgi:hypothetical protein
MSLPEVERVGSVGDSATESVKFNVKVKRQCDE